MRVLLVNNLFQPEPNHLKGLAFARELKRRGHDVHVLTGFPNYPGGKVYSGYRIRWTAREELDEVPITRVAMYPSHDASAARRIASYVSLGASQALHAPFLGKRFDVCHVYLGPLTLMWPALLLRATRGAKILADVQDIWPESVTDSGMLGGFATRALEAWCRRSYRSADRLVVLSPGYKRALVARGVDAAKIEVVYNWSDERPAASTGATDGPLVPGAFNVVYAGNLGKLQGMDTVLEAAKRFGDGSSAVKFVLIGDGVEAERLRRRISDERISNVRMTGRMGVQETTAVLKRADLLLIHVQPTALTRIGIPQKVQAYLAAATPILLAGDGDAAELLARSGGGITCPPSDPAAMAEAIGRVVAMDEEARREMGRKGRRFYEGELSFARGVDRIEGILRDLAQEAAR